MFFIKRAISFTVNRMNAIKEEQQTIHKELQAVKSCWDDKDWQPPKDCKDCEILEQMTLIEKKVNRFKRKIKYYNLCFEFIQYWR